MNKRRNALVATVGAFLIVPFAAFAWTGPTASPPNDNVAAPVNVGTIDQVKNSALGVNGLAVFGNAILNGVGRYFNFGSTAGTGGYGIRDNAGLLEFKNSGGSWESIQATVFNLAGGASSWAVSGNNIYNANTGNVGIGTAAPGHKLEVNGTLGVSGTATFVSVGGGINLNNTAGSALSWSIQPQISGVSYDGFGILQSGTLRLVIGSSGNVGIGTTNPLYKLEVNGTLGVSGPAAATFVSVGGGINLKNTAGSALSWSIQPQISGVSSDGFGILQSGTPRLVIESSGNVGIGTASPGYKLHVAGDIYANGGWLRTSGNAGWYSETWGGGWYMQDSTWIRSYNAKSVYMSAGFDTWDASAVGCGGGLGGGYTFRVCGSQQVTGGLYAAGNITAPYATGLIIRARARFPFWGSVAYCPSAPTNFSTYSACRSAFDERCVLYGYVGGISIDWDSNGMEGFCVRKGASAGTELNLY